jgi:hypothetical protein
MFDRLSYALIGFVLGCLLGAIVWWILGAALSFRGVLSLRGAGLLTMAKYSGITCAVVGFLFKDRVGDFIGSTIRQAFHVRMGTSDHEPWHAPTWVLILFLAAVVFAVWKYVH